VKPGDNPSLNHECLYEERSGGGPWSEQKVVKKFHSPINQMIRLKRETTMIQKVPGMIEVHKYFVDETEVKDVK
jgi:hypothetical protein